MSAYPTLPAWATRASVLAIVSAAALAVPTAALATGDDGHGNGNGRGHVEHGNGNGFGHDKDARGGGHGPDREHPGNGPKDKDKDKPGKGPKDKPCDGPDRDRGCGNDHNRPTHDNQPNRGNTQTIVVAPAPTTAAPTFVAGSSNARQCLSRRYLRLRLSRTYGAVQARVKLNGRNVRVRRTKRYGLTAVIDLRQRVRGTYTVRIAVVTRRGRLVTATRRFRTCAPRVAPTA